MNAAAGQGRAVAAAPASMHPATGGEARVDTRSSAAAEALLEAQPATAAAALADAQRLSTFADADSSATASPTAADSKAARNARDLFAATAPLQLRIDRLVIDGLPRMAGGERALRAALLQELQQLLTAQPPALTQGSAIARLPALELALPADGDAASIGRALARALHRSLGA